MTSDRFSLISIKCPPGVNAWQRLISTRRRLPLTDDAIDRAAQRLISTRRRLPLTDDAIDRAASPEGVFLTSP